MVAAVGLEGGTNLNGKLELTYPYATGTLAGAAIVKVAIKEMMTKMFMICERGSWKKVEMF